MHTTFVEQSHPEAVRHVALDSADRDGAEVSLDAAAEASTCGTSDAEMRVARAVLNELISNPPRTSIVLDVTPAIAKALLERNDNNRPMSIPTLRKYEVRMQRGWHLTGETIIVGKSGRLLDGQHRCKSGVMTGVTFPSHVVFGIDDSIFPFINTGKPRDAADVFAINGVPNATAMAAAVKWLWKYECTGMMNPASWLSPTHDQLYEFFLLHEGLQKSCSVGYRFSEYKVAAPSLMTALHYIGSKIDPILADAFFEKVATGVGFASASEPEAKLRKRLQNERIGGASLDDLYVGAFTVTVWNAVRQNKPVGILRWRTEQAPDLPFPRMI